MSKNFDDLYDDFINKSGSEKRMDENTMNPIIKSALEGMMEAINNKRNKDGEGDDSSDSEQDSSKYSKTEDDNYIREDWYTEDGTFSKITIKGDELSDDITPDKFISNVLSSMGMGTDEMSYDELTLEEKLELAVDNEEYEKAADIKKQITIRDENS